MFRPPQETKASATSLANAASAETNPVRLAQMLSHSGLLGEELPDTKPPAAASSTPEARVGIWEARKENGETWFVRSRSGSPYHWANVERIPPKSRRPRVLLLGESVARGHFYDPGFSFAAALGSVLDFAGEAEIEVIDLARTALSLPGLIQLLHESPALQPDAFIIFAGNNWGLSFESPLQEFERTIRHGGGIADLRAHCEAALIHSARHLVETAAGIARSNHALAVLVVPEFNLKDWHNERAGEAPFLGSRESAAWKSAERSAQRAIADGRLARAETFARKMISVDSATTPTPYEILAEIAQRQGDTARARSFLESARDAGLFLPIMRSPRCFRVIQEALRKEGELHGLTVVDLPRRFCEYLGGELADRRLFLDYCHLTLEGLKITAAMVAESLLLAMGKSSQPWTVLRQVKIEIDPRTSAEASCLAAFHNCDWGQPREIVEFFLREALQADPAIRDTMKDFLTAWLRQAPLMLCSELVRTATSGRALARDFFINVPSSNEKSWNLNLIGILTDVLEPLVPGIREIAGRLLIEEHAADASPINLLRRCYCSTSLEDQDWRNPGGYYRAYRRQSVFRVVCRPTRMLRVTGVARIPGLQGKSRKVEVCVNGSWKHSFRATGRWQGFHFVVPMKTLVQGVNTITVTWPSASWTGEERLYYLLSRWELGRVPEMSPAYGHLHSLVAVSPKPEVVRPTVGEIYGKKISAEALPGFPRGKIVNCPPR
jgi:hypothetical protein